MLDIISIHIPKTGGTTFYNILQQVYGCQVSPSYKRNEIAQFEKADNFLMDSDHQSFKVLHGHLRYKELKFLQVNESAKVICWLRDPVERLISNYRHFIMRNSGENPVRPNSHRFNEMLLTYAQRNDTQNKMSRFLEGIELNELFFFGFLESFESDLLILSQLLGWKDFNIPRLNARSSEEKEVSDEVREEIRSLNMKDYNLYLEAIEFRKQSKKR